MNDSFERRKRNYDTMRSIYDYGMGIIIAGMGAVGIYVNYKKILNFKEFPGETGAYVLSGFFILYGLFRCYRGWRKDY
jgi:hypothetical protein